MEAGMRRSDLANNLASITYPEGQVVQYQNNGLNSSESLQFTVPNVGTRTLFDSASYAARKQPGIIHLSGNGTESQAAYDAKGNITSSTLRKNGSPIYNLTFGRNEIGNIHTASSSAPYPWSATHEYDVLKRKSMILLATDSSIGLAWIPPISGLPGRCRTGNSSSATSAPGTTNTTATTASSPRIRSWMSSKRSCSRNGGICTRIV
jgi:hypothetical protein